MKSAFKSGNPTLELKVPSTGTEWKGENTRTYFASQYLFFSFLP